MTLTPKDRVEASINALKRKNLLPKHTLGYFDTTPKNLEIFTRATLIQKFRQWTCPTCQISVYGPNKLLVEHHKIHSQRRKLRENEIYQRPYELHNG